MVLSIAARKSSAEPMSLMATCGEVMVELDVAVGLGITVGLGVAVGLGVTVGLGILLGCSGQGRS
jgi:hypothetical protein